MRLRDRNRRIAICALLIAIGTVIWSVEEMLPRPMPWAKPGLANAATMMAIALGGPVEGIIVALGRVVLGALLLGRIGSASFIISLSGSTIAAIVMGLIWRMRLPFSVYGISIFGALAHALTQIIVAGWLVYRPDIVLNLLPFVVLPSMITGAIVGLIVAILLNRLKKIDHFYLK